MHNKNEEKKSNKRRKIQPKAKKTTTTNRLSINMISVLQRYDTVNFQT